MQKTPAWHARAIWDKVTEEWELEKVRALMLAETDSEAREALFNQPIFITYPLGPNDGRAFTPAFLYWIMQVEKAHPTGRALRFIRPCYPRLEFEWKQGKKAKAKKAKRRRKRRKAKMPR